MNYLVLLRHGESRWNLQKRFTGQYDSDLTERGRAEILRAKKRVSETGIELSYVHASTLKRSFHSGEIVVEDRQGIIIVKYKELCERDYGDLTGQFHEAVAKQYGYEQMMRWRRAFDERPLNDTGESVKDVLEQRIRPYFQHCLLPLLEKKENGIIVGHNNSLRPLMIELGLETPESINTADLQTGVPIVLKMDGSRVIDRYTLG